MGAGQPWPGPTPRRAEPPSEPHVDDPLGVLHAAQKECSASTAGPSGGRVSLILAEGRPHSPPPAGRRGPSIKETTLPSRFIPGDAGKHRTHQCRASDGQPATFSHGSPATYFAPIPPHLRPPLPPLLSPPPRWMSTSRLWSRSGQRPHAAPSECTSTATSMPATRGARESPTKPLGSTLMQDGERETVLGPRFYSPPLLSRSDTLTVPPYREGNTAFILYQGGLCVESQCRGHNQLASWSPCFLSPPPPPRDLSQSPGFCPSRFWPAS